MQGKILRVLYFYGRIGKENIWAYKYINSYGTGL
jgi:hypothetical protein